MPRPDKYPRWASTDVADPVTLSNNVIEPPEEKKDIGWSRGERPPRNWENWIDRLTYLWIQYLDEYVAGAPGVDNTSSFIPVISGLGGGSFFYALQSGYYQRFGNWCFITMEINWQNNTLTNDVQIPNLPFPAKNDIDVNQVLTISRGGFALAAKGNLKVLLNPGSTIATLWTDDATSGNGTIVNGAGTQGQIIISGTYLIEG